MPRKRQQPEQQPQGTQEGTQTSPEVNPQDQPQPLAKQPHIVTLPNGVTIQHN